MTRLTGLILGMILILSLPLAAAGADATNIAIVDLQRCLVESIEGQKMLEKLKAKKDEMQKRLDEKQEEILRLNEELEKKSMMLSMDAREEKQKEFDRKRREFKYFYEDLNNEMMKADNEVKKDMLVELEVVIKEIGEKGNYLFIFERRSSGLMFMDDSVDITTQVIEAYNLTKKSPLK